MTFLSLVNVLLNPSIIPSNSPIPSKASPSLSICSLVSVANGLSIFNSLRLRSAVVISGSIRKFLIADPITPMIDRIAPKAFTTLNVASATCSIRSSVLANSFNLVTTGVITGNSFSPMAIIISPKAPCSILA